MSGSKTWRLLSDFRARLTVRGDVYALMRITIATGSFDNFDYACDFAWSVNQGLWALGVLWLMASNLSTAEARSVFLCVWNFQMTSHR